MQDFLKSFYEWDKWEGIMHHLSAALILYVMYLLGSNKSSRSTTNILLFTIAIIMMTSIHHNINTRNNKNTNYL